MDRLFKYDLEICKNKVNELLNNDMKKYYLDLASICDKLCKIDPLFPPNGLWVDYYNVNRLNDIIRISNKKKKSSSYIL